MIGFRLIVCSAVVVGLCACDTKATPSQPIPKGWTVTEITPPKAQAQNAAFQIVPMGNGNAYRLNSQSGEVALITEKGVTTLPNNSRTQLHVGDIYILEDGKEVAYQGNQRFDSAIDALLKKYSK